MEYEYDNLSAWEQAQLVNEFLVKEQLESILVDTTIFENKKEEEKDARDM